MKNKFGPIYDSFIARSYKVFDKEIKKAELEALKKELGPIDTYTHIRRRVDATYDCLGQALGYADGKHLNLIELDEMVFTQTEGYLEAAREEFKGMVLDMFHSDTLGEAYEKGKQLQHVIESTAIGDYMDLFDVDLKDGNQKH